jgi:DNA-binding LacI/PurR family transcriptional regulator
MVGLLVPSLANQFFGALACAIETAAARHGCQVMTFSTFRDPDRERVVTADDGGLFAPELVVRASTAAPRT